MMLEDSNTDFSLAAISGMRMQQQATDKILACNKNTAAYGLILTEQQAVSLVRTRTNSLKETKRIEFGEGIIDKLIISFCDSPYISQQNYEEILHELISLFYDFKNDTWDIVTDKELIEFMKEAFNGSCHGSLELLAGRELEQLSRHIHNGGLLKTFQLHMEE